MSGILGKKIGMTRVIQDDGRVIPLTIVQCEPNEIVQVKTVEKDGYPAVILGFGAMKKPKKTRKFYHLKEFSVPKGSETKKGDKISIEIFEEGETVKITGTSKGKGFQGVIKRHGFHSGPGGHGSHHHREPGSIGACAKPGRVNKGKKLPGRTGGEQVTLIRAKIIYIDKEKHLIGIKGALPGPNKGTIIIRKQKPVN